ncbi:EF-P 5-aminopentanol modification-associated protein YfmF [Gorillibacterium timonense]|uniref:EF-P 5-aminopentanol modification-associated protein YfmF n=1 Tax=Gorillibacterium timonense TaxID=1689269 RepID=UPI00071DFFE2|nr:pitrilysin family protein [Gorillibacterium timonense]
MTETAFRRTTVGNVRLHVLPTDRFKTFAVALYIGTPLREEKVTLNAIAPFVLRRGTRSYPTTQQFREKQADLYGAGFGFDVYKRGDSQLVQFQLDIVDDKFVTERESLLRQGLQFLGEAVTKPALQDGHFVSKYVEDEKETVRKKLEAIVNDKIRYAAERCMEEMCKNEPYRLHPLGQLSAIAAITPEALYENYLTWLKESPMDLYIVGNTTEEEAKALVEETFDFPARTGIPGYPNSVISGKTGDVNTVIEKLDVNQGKLNMGLRSGVTYSDDRYAAALMYNGILGAYPHSKLFLNVREKASLAYYAASRFDGHKGIMTIQSGIEVGNYEKACTIIQEQLADMKAGKYSETELTQTRAMITNQLREINDSAYEMIAFDFNTVLSGKKRTAAELAAEVAACTPEAIQEVAQTVELDTIYFLRDRKGD